MKPPRDYQTLKSLIMDRKPDLPKRLAQVAVFALDNPDEIAFGTAASIADSSGVQPSTLVRFAQAIGLRRIFRFASRLPRTSARAWIQLRRSARDYHGDHGRQWR
jgi:DNA-binding MurR/RpiR family transcriptional regulator